MNRRDAPRGVFVAMTAPPQGRPLTPQENEIFAFRQRLLGHVDDSLPGSNEAFLIAYNAVHWLVSRDPDGLAKARLWWARMLGFDGSDSPAAVIVQLESHVRIARERRHGDGTFGDPKHAVPDLRAGLVSRFPESKSLPSETDLADWLDRYWPTRKRGKVTYAGIVARIVHQGRLLGAGKSEEQTRQRVTKALDPKRHARW
jgi:hypothetical protein